MLDVRTLKTITLLVMAAALVGLVAWDIFAATDGVPGDTISEMTLAFARRRPISVFALGLAIGILFGHLFWPQYPSD